MLIARFAAPMLSGAALLDSDPARQLNQLMLAFTLCRTNLPDLHPSLGALTRARVCFLRELHSRMHAAVTTLQEIGASYLEQGKTGSSSIASFCSPAPQLTLFHA